MITCRVEIRPNDPKDGEIIEIVRETGEKEAEYSTTSYREEWYKYPSLEEMRKKHVTEKFHTEIERAGEALAYAGLGFIAAGFYTSRWELIALGSSLFALGLIVREAGNKNKPRIDERIRAFNETFPDQKPITFNPREYLSYFRR